LAAECGQNAAVAFGYTASDCPKALVFFLPLAECRAVLIRLVTARTQSRSGGWEILLNVRMIWNTKWTLRNS